MSGKKIWKELNSVSVTFVFFQIIFDDTNNVKLNDNDLSGPQRVRLHIICLNWVIVTNVEVGFTCVPD